MPEMYDQHILLLLQTYKSNQHINTTPYIYLPVEQTIIDLKLTLVVFDECLELPGNYVCDSCNKTGSTCRSLGYILLNNKISYPLDYDYVGKPIPNSLIEG